VDILEGQPPVAGQARPHDVTGIEVGLAVILGAWLASKLAAAGQGILGFLGGLGRAVAGAGGAAGGGTGEPAPPVEPDVPPIEVPPVVP
jgi:hypothetical protein